MIFPLGGLILGLLSGGLMAVRRGGKPADIAQWAAVQGLIGAVLGTIAMIAVERAMT